MDGAETSPVLISTRIRPDQRFDVLRWAQMFGSLLCIVLAGVLYPREEPYVTPIVVVLTVSSAFWFIATIDVISWVLRERIRFRSWLMIAVAAFLMFCLCAGLMIPTSKASRVLMIILGAASFVTAVLFLLDVLWISYSAISERRATYPRMSTVKPTVHGDNVDKAVSVCFLFDINEYECPKMRKRYGVTVKPPRREVIPSYGGTFPVSRDLTPLPSPEPKGLTIEPRRSAFSNTPNRPTRRVSISPSKGMSMSPSRITASPGDPNRQAPRASTASYSPSRSTQTDPERTRSSRLDDRTSGRRPERDYKTQWTSTRGSNLDTVPERNGSWTSWASESGRAAGPRKRDDEHY